MPVFLQLADPHDVDSFDGYFLAASLFEGQIHGAKRPFTDVLHHLVVLEIGSGALFLSLGYGLLTLQLRLTRHVSLLIILISDHCLQALEVWHCIHLGLIEELLVLRELILPAIVE